MIMFMYIVKMVKIFLMIKKNKNYKFSIFSKNRFFGHNFLTRKDKSVQHFNFLEKKRSRSDFKYYLWLPICPQKHSNNIYLVKFKKIKFCVKYFINGL